MEIIGIALMRGIGQLFLATWIIPAGIMFLAAVVYIVVKVIQEFRE